MKVQVWGNSSRATAAAARVSQFAIQAHPLSEVVVHVALTFHTLQVLLFDQNVDALLLTHSWTMHFARGGTRNRARAIFFWGGGEECPLASKGQYLNNICICKSKMGPKRNDQPRRRTLMMGTRGLKRVLSCWSTSLTSCWCRNDFLIFMILTIAAYMGQE